MSGRNLSTICPLPFKAISVGMTGDMGPCTECKLTDYTKIEDYWNSKELQQLRSDMINGIRNSACNECYRREDAGAWNTRQSLLSLVDEIDPISPVIKNISLRFSNMCNYKCIDCNWGTSSSIFQEDIKRGIRFDSSAIINAGGSEDELLNQAKLHVHKMDCVTFSGGEPTVQWQHWELLKYMVDNNIKPNLKYFTNLSKLNYKNLNALELWKNFKTLSISVGVDGLHQRCEYFRKNMDFEKTLENIRLVKQSIPQAEIFVVITLTWLNAISAVDLFEWFLLKEPNINITLNQVIHPHLDMRLAPYEKKIQISQAFDKMYEIATHHNYFGKDAIKGYKNYLWSMDESEKFPSAILWLKDLDRWRNENFIEIFPEHQDLSKYYYL